jgi:glycosyltransferase involved in cell wall biosynthesis
VTGTEPGSVSLVLTVRNEETSLDALFRSIAAQTRFPDELVLVDGGSTDHTLEIAHGWVERLPLIIISAAGASISQGRTMALQRASGDIIAVTDAGVVLEPDWLEMLMRPFSRPIAQQPDVVAGFFEARPESRFELVLGATTLPDVDEIRPERFLPSSRSLAFRRSLFDAGMRYPEWLDYCEDLIFDFRLKRAGARFEFQPDAIAGFRPRRALGDYLRQYFLYARGDGKAGLFARRHLLRYATYFVALPLLATRRDRIALALGIAGGVIYLRQPARRLLRRRNGLTLLELALGVLSLPGLRAVGDLAKMAGYPVGLRWRWRRFSLRKTWRTIPEESSMMLGVILDE